MYIGVYESIYYILEMLSIYVYCAEQFPHTVIRYMYLYIKYYFT